MIFLFTTSDKIGAKAIRWALNEPCSHFAVTFDEKPDGFGIVFHSSFHGVRIEWLHDFMEHNKVIFALRPKEELGLNGEENIYQSLVSKLYGKDYDWRLFSAFGFYALRKKITGKDFPSESEMNNKNAYLCTEIYRALKEVKPQYFDANLPNTFISPYRLYLSMKDSPELIDVPRGKFY